MTRGGVPVFTRMTEVPVAKTVHLREEHADITRMAVDRHATQADFSVFKKGSIEVRETAGEAVVSKTARVVGEVEVEAGKTATERAEIVHRTVRKTKGDVERVDGGSVPFTAASPTCMLPMAQRSRWVPPTPVWSKKLDPKHGTQQPHRK